MTPVSVERYSTAQVAPAVRLAFWNDLARRTFSNIVVDADDSDGFEAELVRLPLGELNLAGSNSAPACVSSTGDPDTGSASERAVVLHLQYAGHSLNSQSGRDAVLETGDFTLCDCSRPYSVRFSEANHMIALRIPLALLSDRLGDIDPLICAPMKGDRGPGAMLSAFLTALWAHVDEPGDDNWAEAMSRVIIDLVVQAYRPLLPGHPMVSARGQWRGKARAYIDGHICDPGLGVSEIAQALGVSSRYVQMLFAEDGTTPSAYIMDRRLRLAAERLRSAEDRGVTEVAMAVGFNDLTHFGRVFRRRFGVTPRSYREGARMSRWDAAEAHPEPRLVTEGVGGA